MIDHDNGPDEVATPVIIAQDSPKAIPSGELRPRKREVNGWVILDKPVGATSTHAVSLVKRAFHAKKAGHAGTLDPLASGILPLALGEATKTVPFVMDGQKAYRFTVKWGEQTNTDDTEGQVIATSDKRPSEADITALLPRFIGEIMQLPPKFSAIKVDGERAYDLARDGEEVVLQPRPVIIDHLTLVAHDTNTATFEAECGKGTYVRAIARDMGLALGCLGHIIALRRTRVGPFVEADAVSLVDLQADPAATLKPVAMALGDLPQVQVSKSDSARLMRGQSVLLRGRDALVHDGLLAIYCQATLVAIGVIGAGELQPRRVFHLGA
jgi:tRNA pseudouridine55 synthase